MTGTIAGELPACLARLSAVFPDLHPVQPGIWGFSLPSCGPLQAMARFDDLWLSLSVPLGKAGKSPARPHSFWSLLEQNSGLPGSARIAIPPGSPHPALAAEIVLGEAAGLEKRLREACRGLAEAARRFSGLTGSPELEAPPATSPGPSPARPPESPQDLEALCKEAGWACSLRSAGLLAVDLAMDRLPDFNQASIAAAPEGAIRVSVDLLPPDGLSPVAAEAMAAFLLRATGSLRFLRAAASTRDARKEVSLEVRFDEPPGAEELSAALSACAAACEVCGREVHALQEENLARAYLALCEHRSRRSQPDRAQVPQGKENGSC